MVGFMDAKYVLAETWTPDCRFRLTIDVRSVIKRQKPINLNQTIILVKMNPCKPSPMSVCTAAFKIYFTVKNRAITKTAILDPNPTNI